MNPCCLRAAEAPPDSSSLDCSSWGSAALHEIMTADTRGASKPAAHSELDSNIAERMGHTSGNPPRPPLVMLWVPEYGEMEQIDAFSST